MSKNVGSRGKELATNESLTAFENASMNNEEREDQELKEVGESLTSIENIMVAENKRRLESNQIMHSFIEDYLKTLNESITNRVDTDFKAMQARFSKINGNLSSIEHEIES